MKQKIPRRTIANNLLMVLLLFSVIYQSGTVQASNNPDDLVFKSTRILMILAPVILVVYMRKKLTKHFFFSFLTIAFTLEMLAIINYFLYRDSAGTLQYKILVFMLLLFVSYTIDRSHINLEIILFKVLLFIAMVTITMYVAVELLKIPLPYTIFSRGKSFVYRNYFNLFYSYSYAKIPRLCGLFWEPGVYQIYLNLALFLYYKLNIKNKFQLSILCINILFAQSTSGYIIATIILIAILIDRKRASLKTRRIIELVGAIIAMACILIVFTAKKDATNSAGDSYFDRILQAKIGLQLFFQKPLFGTGFYNTNQYALLIKVGSGNSNGLITWMYTTGIVGLSLVLAPFLVNVWSAKTHKEKTSRWIWLIFVLVQNMTEPIYALSIMIFIISKEYYQAIKGYKYTTFRIEKSILCKGERKFT